MNITFNTISQSNKYNISDNIKQNILCQRTNIDLSKAISFKGLSDKNIQTAGILMNEKKAEKTFQAIIDGFKKFPQVEAIAIGGSQKTNTSDKGSDIDIEIYTNSEIPVEERLKLVKQFSSKYEVGGEYFGPGDEFFVDDMNQELDVAFFDKKWMDETIENVWVRHQPSNGYTTCFLHTIKNCEPLYDKDNWLASKKALLCSEYPKELKNNIIKRNMMLLKDKPFSSYYEQIEKAISRNDRNSVNHRLAAFMESYFDIIFAMNETLHPGEKKLVKFAKEKCKILPEDFEENIEKVLTQPNENTLSILDDMVIKLKSAIKQSDS